MDYESPPGREGDYHHRKVFQNIFVLHTKQSHKTNQLIVFRTLFAVCTIVCVCVPKGNIATVEFSVNNVNILILTICSTQTSHIRKVTNFRSRMQTEDSVSLHA